MTLAALLSASLYLRLSFIGASLPYVGHVDEPFLSSNATWILQQDTLNPGFFRYPSLPIYLTAACILTAATVTGTEISDLEAGWEPFYSYPQVMVSARWVFAILSTATLVMVAILGFRFGGGLTAVLAPGIVSLSGLYYWMSWAYLNVDVLATFFAMSCLAFVFVRWDATDWFSKSVIPGVLAGLAAASKYNAALVLATCGVVIVLRCKDRPVARLAALGGCFLLTFLVCVPYSVLDSGHFLADVGAEASHYRSGHPGFDGAPGLPQLVYYIDQLVREFGRPVMLLAGLGVLSALRLRSRQTIALLVFPVTLLLFMSSQRVHFLRNILPVFVLVGLFSALGTREVLVWIRRIVRSRVQGVVVDGLVLTLIGAAIFWGAPRREIAARYRLPVDSRVLATEWLSRNLPRHATIAFPSHLPIDLRRMPGDYAIRTFETGPGQAEALLDESRDGDLYVLVPSFRDDPGDPERARAAATWNREMNVIATAGSTLVRMGSHPVPVEHAFVFDPGLSIVLVRASRPVP